MKAAAVYIEGFMVIIVYCQVLCQAFWASGSLFSVFRLKNRNTKTGLEKDILFLVSYHVDRYLSWRPVYIPGLS